MKIFVFAVLDARAKEKEIARAWERFALWEKTLAVNFEIVERRFDVPLKDLVSQADVCFTLDDYPFCGSGAVQAIAESLQKEVTVFAS